MKGKRGKVAPKSSAPIAGCKLCGTVATLHDSHIVPRWTYRRVIQTGSGGLVRVDSDGARLNTEQLSEYMLCKLCEDRFERYERYVAEHSLSSNGKRFPARDAARLLPEVSDAEVVFFDVSPLDCRMFERFAVSVFWRASESDQLPDMSLGQFHDAMRAYLLDESAALPECATVLIQFTEAALAVELGHIVIVPHTARGNDFDHHRFACFGLVFSLLVGGDVPRGALAISASRAKLFFIYAGNGDLWEKMGAHVAELKSRGRNFVPQTPRRRR